MPDRHDVQLHRSLDASGDPISAGWARLADGIGGETWGAVAPGTGSGDVVAHGTLGATESMDFGAGTWHWGTLDQDCDITLSGAIAGRDCGLTVEIIEDGTGGWTPTFLSSGSVVWLGGSVPTHDTTAGTTTIYGFLCRDGSTWVGGVLGGGSGASTAAALAALGVVGAIVMEEGSASPPEPVWTEDGTDYVYAELGA